MSVSVRRAGLYAAGALAWAAVPLAAYAAGLVPCDGLSCQFCSLAQLVQNVINFMIGISIPIAAALFAYAGFEYATAGIRGKPGDTGKAKEIFGTAAVGFLLAISGWLIVSTFLHIVLQNGPYGAQANWFEIQCVDQATRTINAPLSSIVQKLSGSIDAVVGGIGGGTNTSGGQSVSLSIRSGACAPDTNAFGAYANALSCICGAESGGAANRPSGTDITSDGKPFSWGLYQVNLTVHDLNYAACMDAVKRSVNTYASGNLNCTKAFSGTNYKAKVTDKLLYNACVTAITDPGCNTAAAQDIARKEGLNAWSTWKKGTQSTCRQ